MIKIYIINLKSRKNKLFEIQNQLDTQNIKYEIIEGIDGKTLNMSYLNNNGIKICNEYYWKVKKRNMTFGELGCTLSHLKIYEDIVKKDFNKCVILEDDVIIPDYFINKLKNIYKNIDDILDWDLIYLGRKKMNFGKNDEKYNDNFIKCGTSWWSCGYIINKKACDYILNSKIKENLITIDEYLPIISGCYYPEYLSQFKIDRILEFYSLKELIIYPNKNAFFESDTENSIGIDNYDDSLTIIGVATVKNDGYYRFVNSCKYYGLKYKILGENSNIEFSYGNVEKLFFLKKEIFMRNDNEIVLISDVFDVILMTSAKEILQRFKEMNVSILFSAEIVCWPDKSLSNKFPKSVSKYKYLNSGGFIGKVKYLKEMFINNIDNDIYDDQLYFQHCFLNSKNIFLDYECKIFQTFDINILNNNIDSCHFHGNGCSNVKKMFDLYSFSKYNFFHRNSLKIKEELNILVYIYNSNNTIIETINSNIKNYKNTLILDKVLIINNILTYSHLWIIDGNYIFKGSEVLDKLIELDKVFSTIVMKNNQSGSSSCKVVNLFLGYDSKLAIVENIRSNILIKTSYFKTISINELNIDTLNNIFKDKLITVFGLISDINYKNIYSTYVICNCKQKLYETNKLFEFDFFIFDKINENDINSYGVCKDLEHSYGELINFISHMEILKKSKLSSNEYITIYEDNILISNSYDYLKNIYKNIKSLDFDLIILTNQLNGEYNNKDNKDNIINIDLYLTKIDKINNVILGYIISNRGINKFLNSNYNKNITRIDNFINNFYKYSNEKLDIYQTNINIVSLNNKLIKYDKRINSKLYEKNESYTIIYLTLYKYNSIFIRNCELLGIKYKIIKVNEKLTISSKNLKKFSKNCDTKNIILLNCLSVIIFNKPKYLVNFEHILNLDNNYIVYNNDNILKKKIINVKNDNYFIRYKDVDEIDLNSMIMEFEDINRNEMLSIFNNLRINYDQYNNYKKIDEDILINKAIIIAIFLEINDDLNININKNYYIKINDFIINLRKNIKVGVLFYSNRKLNETFNVVKNINEINIESIDYIWYLDVTYKLDNINTDLLCNLLEYNKDIINFLQKNENDELHMYDNDILISNNSRCWIVDKIFGNFLIKKTILNEIEDKDNILIGCEKLNIVFHTVNNFISNQKNTFIKEINFDKIDIKKVLIYDRIGDHNIYCNFLIYYFNKNKVSIDVLLPNYDNIDKKLIYNKIDNIQLNYDIIIVINELNNLSIFSKCTDILLIKVNNKSNITYDINVNIITIYPSDYYFNFFYKNEEYKKNEIIGYSCDSIKKYMFNNKINLIYFDINNSNLSKCKYYIISEKQFDSNKYRINTILCKLFVYGCIPIIPKRIKNKYNLEGCIIYINKKVIIKNIENYDVNNINEQKFHKILQSFIFLENDTNKWEEKYINKECEIVKIDKYICKSPFFSDYFCKKLIRNAENKNNWHDIINVNSQYDERFNVEENVPTYDVNLTDLGLYECFNYIVMNYISKIVKKLYNWSTVHIHRAFIVKYEIGNQEYLKPHYDTSTYTINILLNDKFEGGGTHFINENITINDKVGTIILHPGSPTHYHEGLKITSGKRYVLIAFIK